MKLRGNPYCAEAMPPLGVYAPEPEVGLHAEAHLVVFPRPASATGSGKGSLHRQGASSAAVELLR